MNKQTKEMKTAAIEAMKHSERDFILYLSQSLRNMKEASSSISSPLTDEGILAMAEVLKDDLIRNIQTRNYVCLEGVEEETYPVYNNLSVVMGYYKVWISKKDLQFLFVLVIRNEIKLRLLDKSKRRFYGCTTPSRV